MAPKVLIAFDTFSLTQRNPTPFCRNMNFEPLMFHPTPSKDANAFLDVDCDPWVHAPLVQEPGEDTLRRVQSTSAIQFSLTGEGASMHRWNSGGRDTGPLPIRSTRLAHPDDISSLESSQSFLAAGSHASSFTEDSSMMHYFPGGNNAPLSCPQDALAAVEFAFPNSAPAAAPVRIPAQGGHWAWVPENASNSVPINTGPLPLPSSLPNSAPTAAHHHIHHHHHMVPVNTGALPLPVPMTTTTTTTRYTNNTAPDLDLDLDIGFLDSFDVMEMADTLAPSLGAPGSRPITMMNSRRAAGIGSCPLPTLLEDSLSAEDDGSNNSMRSGLPSSPSLDRSGSGTMTTSNSRGSGGSGGGGGATGRSFIPIPGARSMPLKVQRSAHRSASQPHLPSLLGSSLPSSSDRPMRNAARRSLVVTAAALRETMGDSDSEDFSAEDGLPMSGSFHVRRNSTGGQHQNHHHHTSAPHRQSHGSSSSLAKKKHNPWSLEETLALVEGVRLAGVGKWAEIKRLPVPAVADMLETRTPVDLKDKWRNLTRVARLPKAALRQRLQRSPSDVPLETMLTVKQLMEVVQDQE
jgi:Myb-like DNA-binding domain